jgi:hypothetical protein
MRSVRLSSPCPKDQDMSKDKSQIIAEIENFMAKHGGQYAQWYVGICSTPKQTLFGKHKFKQGDKGLFRTAHSEMQAQEVGEYFVACGCKGDVRTLKAGEVGVYAYQITPHTKQ